MTLEQEMLLLTLNRLQYIPRTISDKARLEEMLHLIDAGGFVLYPNNAIQPKTASTLEDLTDSQLADLSTAAQHKLGNNQLFGFAELPENCPDIAIIQQFLKLNFAGVPQSKEHIAHVKSILNKM